MIRIPEHVKNLRPYKAGKPIEELAREKGLTKIVKLASNENPLGPSPKALEAIRKSVHNLHRYSNPSAFRLVNAVSKKFKKKPEQIVACSGSDSLLQYIITAFSDNDDELLTSEGTFIGWYVNANKYGRKSRLVPLKNYQFDLKRIQENINSKTKVIYLANPNNPTGTIFTKKEFEDFLAKVPRHILIILDEAYTIYAEENNQYPDGLIYDAENLIVLRTLSKAYGLAGLRIGIAFGPENLIKELYKVKLPFEPNLLAQEGAAAALDDEDFLIRTRLQNRKSLSRMSAAFLELGIEFISTYANFFLLIFPSTEFAVEFCEECLNQGLILRHTGSFGIPNGVRINSGTDEETEFAINIIANIYPELLEKHKITA